MSFLLYQRSIRVVSFTAILNAIMCFLIQHWVGIKVNDFGLSQSTEDGLIFGRYQDVNSIFYHPIFRAIKGIKRQSVKKKMHEMYRTLIDRFAFVVMIYELQLACEMSHLIKNTKPDLNFASVTVDEALLRTNQIAIKKKNQCEQAVFQAITKTQFEKIRIFSRRQKMTLGFRFCEID